MKKMYRFIALMLALLLIPVCVPAEEAPEKDWYEERADFLLAELHELMASESYISTYSSSEDIAGLIASWSLSTASEPLSVSRFTLPDIHTLMTIAGLSGEELPALTDAALKKTERQLAPMLVSMFNGQMGTVFLAASSIASVSEGYIMPEDFSPCMLFYEYEEICVCVSFAQVGEEVVMATAQVCSPQILTLLSAPF